MGLFISLSKLMNYAYLKVLIHLSTVIYHDITSITKVVKCSHQNELSIQQELDPTGSINYCNCY